MMASDAPACEVLSTNNGERKNTVSFSQFRRHSDMNSRRTWTTAFPLALLCLAAAIAAAQDSTSGSKNKSVSQDAEPTGTEILKRALDRDRANLDAARDYVYQEREVSEWLDKEGEPKKTEVVTHDVLMIYGEQYEKLVA